MKSEKYVVEALMEILTHYDPSDPDDYLDEYDQAEYVTLMDQLDRDFTDDENAEISRRRKEYFGE